MASLAIILALINLTLAQWAANTQNEDRTLDEIYQAAQKESGQLTVLWGGDAKIQAQSTIAAFQTRFPSVTLNLTVDSSKYHTSNLDRSFYQHAPYADIVTSQTLSDFPHWQSQDRLLYYKPQNFSEIDNNQKEPQGAWLPLFFVNIGNWVYDSTALNETELPKSFAEVVEDKWKGKLVLTYPNDDDALGYLFSLIVSHYGFDWLDALARNDVQWVRGTQVATNIVDPVKRSASDSQRVLTFTSIPLGVSSAVKTVQQSDDTMAWFERGAIMADTKRPEMARLFTSWLLSDEFQRPFAANGTLTPMGYLNEEYGLRPDVNITGVEGYERYTSDRAAVEWWRNQFELTLGYPVGPDPATMNS